MREGFLFLLLFNTLTFFPFTLPQPSFSRCLPLHVSLCLCGSLGGPALHGSQIFFFRADCLLVSLRHRFQKVGEGGGGLLRKAYSLRSLTLLVTHYALTVATPLGEEEGKSPPCRVAVQAERLSLQNEIQISMLGFVQTSSRALL